MACVSTQENVGKKHQVNLFIYARRPQGIAYTAHIKLYVIYAHMTHGERSATHLQGFQKHTTFPYMRT